MRCKTCDYRLWNLTSRQCPECGSAFLPSEFDFTIGTVQFCCPHCEQPYYGTGDRGHLVPSTFACVRCGRHISMDEMVLRPAQGVEEDDTQVERMPWLDRGKRGPVWAWWSTVWMAMTGPSRLIRLMPRDAPDGRAWWFTLITSGLALVGGAGVFILIPLIISAFSGGGSSGLTRMSRGCATLGIGFLGFTVGTLIVIVLWGLLAHGLLRLMGQTRGTLRHTFQAFCYSSGANALVAVPCLGFYLWVVSFPWWIVSAILMLRETHKVGGGRAAVAVLPGPVLGFIGIAALIYSAATSAGGPFAGTGGATAETQAVTDALLGYAENNGSFPRHAVELIADDELVSADYVALDTGTFEGGVPVGDTHLGRLPLLSDDALKKEIQTAVDALPDNTIAHRLGDFVFTYHGIDPTKVPPGLWLVIYSQDPDLNTVWEPAQFVVVGQGAGATFTILGTAAIKTQLATQNRLRAQYNLPPLPDPSTVTHAQPARAPTTRPAPPPLKQGSTGPMNPLSRPARERASVP
ncbi:MAG: YIP1 family protein [Phycisphaerae bacterium]